MNYENLANSIWSVATDKPNDRAAYTDLFALCRDWEEHDFASAHEWNKKLLKVAASQVKQTGSDEFYEQWRRCLLFEAPHAQAKGSQ